MKFELIKCVIYGDDADIAIIARQQVDEGRAPQVRIDVCDFDPYFYIPIDETEKAREMMESQEGELLSKAREIAAESENGLSVKEAEDIIDEERNIVGVHEGFTEIDRNNVTKVVTSHPGVVPKIRGDFSQTWESDIPYEMRFRIDTGIKEVFEIPDSFLQEKGEHHYQTSWTLIEPCPDENVQHDPRNFYFDIEVGGYDQKLPEDDDLNPIACITGFDSYDNEVITWVWRDDYEQETNNRTYTYNREEHNTGVDTDEILSTIREVYSSHASDVANFSDWEDEDRFKNWVSEHLSGKEREYFEDEHEDFYSSWEGDDFHSFVFELEEVFDEDEESEELNIEYPWEIRKFSQESNMLINFFNYFQDGDVDVLSGWYSDKYDVPYIMERSRELDIDPSIWSKFGSVNDGLPIDGYGQAAINGLFMNDLERRYDNLEGPSSTALENVAANELGMEWEQESTNIQEIWDNDIDKLLEYNAHDVVATMKVDEKAGVTDFFFQKMYMTGCRVEDIEKDSKVITYYCMFEAERNEIIPRGTSQTHKEFGGGRVLMPDRQGLMRNIAVLDLSKIYPSIMISLNLSYENAYGVDPVLLYESLSLSDIIPEDAWLNLDDDIKSMAQVLGETKSNDKVYKEIQWSFEDGDLISPLDLGKEARKDIWDNLYDMKPDGSLVKTKDWEFVDPDIPNGTRLPNGVRIDMEHDGIITRILKEMFDLRYFFGDQMDALDPKDPNYKAKYDRLYNKRQNMKDNINAVFGYTGYKKSPLFRPEIAMTTTFIGRNVLKMCEVVAHDELGYEIIYGDTDSIFVELGTDDPLYDWQENPRGAVYEAYRVGEYVNARMDDFARNFCGIEDHMFEIEFEKLYSVMFQGSQKKRYAGRKTYEV